MWCHVGASQGGGIEAVKYSGGKEFPSVEVAYAELKDLTEVPETLQRNDKHILLRSSSANPIARWRRGLYSQAGVPAKQHASGGFARPMNLLTSTLCTRIDLYGFSSSEKGGKYFAKTEKVRPAHSLALEHWVNRYMMSKGRLCVYGD
ncbi:hypothetical protein CYMTET_38187 [Cymbomonas tetramitiformis]|uniref:Uncharacterized protein n=1 Tax=Cymbomonas tetramitiformis TaxID=36881 RepID=A0AAE0F5X9_9CHLO|nr:hypothetical protein CYMTET_38187 [Cymbomonas tetramitiformis]